MFDEIATLLRKYAEGSRTRGGFSELELFIARLRQEERFDPKRMIPHLIKLLELPDAKNEQFAMGINLTIQKTGCRCHELRDALERRVIDDGADLDPRSQFELATAFIFSGGDLTPQALDQLSSLRSKRPELWLDLAIAAYPLDVQGLTEAVVELFRNNAIEIKWTSLKPRYLKLVNATGSDKFHWFVEKVAASLPTGDQEDFVSWINTKRGSKLQAKPPRAAEKSAAPTARSDDINFLSDRSPLAKRIPMMAA